MPSSGRQNEIPPVKGDIVTVANKCFKFYVFMLESELWYEVIKDKLFCHDRAGPTA